MTGTDVFYIQDDHKAYNGGIRFILSSEYHKVIITKFHMVM